MSGWLNRLKTFLPDLLALLFAFMVMLSFVTMAFVGLGWINYLTNLPAAEQSAVALDFFNKGQDSDDDMLPDLIELAPRGEPVYNDDGLLLGYGTGTDPFSKDSDGDLFTDALENKFGTSNDNWLLPGIVWIIWAIFIAVLVYYRFLYRPDRVKEYVRNEMMISQASVGKGGKFAYGGSTFGKKYDDMTEEERRELVETDARFHQLTSFQDTRPDQKVKRGFPMKTILQLGIAGFFTFLIYWAVLGSQL